MLIFLHLLSLFFRVLPGRVTDSVARGLGWIWYHLLPVRKKTVMKNLQRAFSEKSTKEHRFIARKCFEHWARSAIEFLRLPGMDRSRFEACIECQGLEHLHQALSLGKGVIVVTAHLGNFDLMACFQAQCGVPLHILTRIQHVRGINRFWMKVRAQHGVGLILAGESVFRIHRLLKQGRVVGMVIDQHMPGEQGIPVPFFGRPASTTHAPATLALATGAALLPVSITRLKEGRHRILIEPALKIDEQNERAGEIERLTHQMNRWLEDRIRLCPEQWLWLHRRWKLPEN